MANSGKSNGLVGEVFYPSETVVAEARLKDWDALAEKARRDPQAFWAAEARRAGMVPEVGQGAGRLEEALLSNGSSAAKVNIVHNAIDRHLKTYRKNKLALIWECEDGKLHQTYSYYAMNREVSRMANIIKAMGVRKGDRVTIYMGRIPEIIFAMLACAKIGAVHSVVFGGFSVDALPGPHRRQRSRRWSSPPTAAYQNGKVVELKRTVDEALKRCPTVENVIVVKRIGHEVPMDGGRDHWYHDLLRPADRQRQMRHRGHGRRGPALHPLHLRLHRQAQGHRAHARRLHGRHLHHAQVRLRPQRRRPLVVRRRSGLGDRPLLHRLWPAAYRRDLLHVRGRTHPIPIPTAGGSGRDATASPSSTPRPPPSAG